MKKLQITLILTILLSFIGCKETRKEKVCEFKNIDKTFLKEYEIIIDSCKVFNDFPKTKYFDNGKLLMEGFSDRLIKEGKWSFYDNNEKLLIFGDFEKSKPKNNWDFQNLGKIEWNVYNNTTDGYSFSYPKNWELIKPKGENFTSLIDPEKSNFLLSVTSGDFKKLETEFNEYVEKIIENLKNDNSISNLEYKKVDLKPFDGIYELNYQSNNENIKFESNELIIKFNDRIMIFSIKLNKDSNSEYSILKEIITTSFVVYGEPSSLRN